MAFSWFWGCNHSCLNWPYSTLHLYQKLSKLSDHRFFSHPGVGIPVCACVCVYFFLFIFCYFGLPSIDFLNCLFNSGSQGLERTPAGSQRGSTPWSGHQSVAGQTHKTREPFKLTFTSTAYLVSPINLTCRSLDCRRKPEQLEKTHEGGLYRVHKERPMTDLHIWNGVIT